MSLKFIPFSEIKLDHNLPKQIEFFDSFFHYYKEYYLDNYTDLSFIIFDQDKFIGYVICAALNKTITTPDGAVDIFLITELSLKEQKEVYRQILCKLTEFATNYDCSAIVIKDSTLNSSLSILGEMLFNQRFESRLTFTMDISFANFSEKSFHASLRKRYKSFINWGKKELKIDFINQDNLDRGQFNQFQKFHHKTSGRITRSQETWNIQYNMIQKGFSELTLATYNNQLVAGAIFSDYGNTSIYSTGVYERSLFDFGLSHFILYEGIIRSFNRCLTSKFSLGYFDTDIRDPKWYNIQFFKKGFCEKLAPVIFWSKKV